MNTSKTIARVANVSITPNTDGTLSLKVVSEVVVKSSVHKNHGLNTCVTLSNLEEKHTTKKSEINTYVMYEVNPQDLMDIRLSNVPGAVYKKGEHFFYAPISGNMNFAGKTDNSFGNHLCGEQCTQVCKGCPRTRDLTVAYQQRIGKKTFRTATDKSWRIEKYDFIYEGLETFNMSNQNDAFIVFQCGNYSSAKNTRKPSHKDIGKLKAGLASFVWEDFSGNRSEMLLRLKSKKLM